MCGDGANDCGALKAAHAGISLSEAESSVASPFTSKEANIKCVPNLIREGRAALVTSFGIFKYMAVYSLTQFSSVIILYTISANLSDLQFLYIDLFLISVFALFFGHTEPFDGPLVKQPPSASLVSIAPVFSILLHMGTIIGVQNVAFSYLHYQPWFTPYVPKDNDYKSDENYTLFAVSTFQYIIMAIVFSQGAPYRKSLVTNPRLLGSLIIMTAITIYLALYPFEQLLDLLEMKLPQDFNYRLTMIGFALVNFLIAIFIEYGIINYMLTKKMDFTFSIRKNKKSKSKKPYLEIESELSKRTDWPSVTPSPNLSYSNSTGVVESHDENSSGASRDTLKRSRLSGLGSCSSILVDEKCSKTGSISIPNSMEDCTSLSVKNLRSRSYSNASGNHDSHMTDHINNCLNSSIDAEKNAHLELEMIQNQHKGQGHP